MTDILGDLLDRRVADFKRDLARFSAEMLKQLAPKTDEGAPTPGPNLQAAAESPAAPSSLPRRFQLIRHLDVSGVSGTGVVAEGVQFDDGAVALRWKGDHPSTAIWDSIAAILAVHGHEGATELRWMDGE